MTASVALDVWDSVVGHSDSMDRQMAVFQSLTTSGRIRLPSCHDSTKNPRPRGQLDRVDPEYTSEKVWSTLLGVWGNQAEWLVEYWLPTI